MTDQTDYDSDVDAMSFDSDGDGYAESTVIDTDGDSVADTFVEEDPYPGALAVATDTDGDGVVDTLAVDYDGDGLIDEAYTESDLTDGVGMDPSTDTSSGDDNDFDSDDSDDSDDGVDGSIDGPFTSTDDGGDLTDDPGLDDGVHGDPPGDMTYHQTQPGPVDCLPTSVAMTLSDLTGQDVPAADVIEMANANGFMTDTGMSADNALTLFESYGVDAELSSGTIDGLRDALDNGDSIVVGIDSADLYAGGGGPFDEGLDTGHAVVITGIDDGPPGAVYINDPGFPDGAGVEIPLDQFMDSWEDTDNTMVVADMPGGDADVSGAEAVDAGEVDTAVADTSDALQRMILLPLNFVIGGD